MISAYVPIYLLYIGGIVQMFIDSSSVSASGLDDRKISQLEFIVFRELISFPSLPG